MSDSLSLSSLSLSDVSAFSPPVSVSLSSPSLSLSNSSTQQQHFLSCFPLDVLRVICEYLTLKEIGYFDLSLLNHSLRPRFFEILNGFFHEEVSVKPRSKAAILWLTSRRLFIEKIAFETYGPESLEFILTNFHSLKSVSFPGNQLPVEMNFYQALAKCRGITSISFEGCAGILNEGLQLLFQDEWPLLRSIDLSKCSYFDSRMLQQIGRNCPNINQLLLSDLNFITDADVDVIIHSFPRLEALGLVSASITDTSTIALLKAYPKMKVLLIDSCRGVSTEGKLRVLRTISMRQLLENDPEEQLLGTRSIRRVLSEAHMPPIEDIISLGVVPRLIEFLSRFDYPTLQYEACWALTNIASGTSEHTAVIITAGGVPQIVALLRSTDLDVVEQATWALGNIAGDNVMYRDLVLSCGALPLLTSVSHTRVSLTRNLTWTISNLCRGKPAPPLEEIVPAFPYLLSQLLGNDLESQVDACFAISYVSDGENDRIGAVLAAGVLPPIMTFLSEPSKPNLQQAALRVVGNLLTGDEYQTQAVLDMNVLPHLLSLIWSPKRKMQKEACWSISNITAGTTQQIQAVIDCGIFPALIALGNTATHDIRKECVWCLSNATEQGSPEQLNYLVSIGTLPFIATSLDGHGDQQLVPVCLTAVHNILKSNVEEFSPIVMENLGKQIRRYRSGSYDPNVGSIIADIVGKLPDLPDGLADSDDADGSDEAWETASGSENENEDLIEYPY